ncbi:MAG: hypothetical protein JWM04_119, partial [Verrucomicrobiales bacterium]|nr:hypothetical protein [Verrucomicrobiales bacterium]
MMLLLLLSVLLSLRAGATDFFVRPTGDDSLTGTSTNSSWRTIDRLNRTAFHPGDRILFEGGKSFSGNLRLTAEDSGATNAPVIIGSFGHDRATLLSGNATGVTIESAGGIVMENLIISGAGLTNNSGYGILCDNRRETGARLEGLRIQNVEVSGFGIHGILISGLQAGYRHVLVENCVMRDNLRGGMEIAGRLAYDSTNYAHADVRVTNCRAFNNTGDPNFTKNHSGSGIVVYQVDGGLIDHCAAWNNGADGQNRGGGGVGIWTCASRKIVIQHCESFSNKTRGLDGGGFDIDGGSEDCVLQYNYSHDNFGPGLMVYTYAWAPHHDRGNIVRFNISENDSRKSRTYAGIWVRNDGNGMKGIEIYNNTVVMGEGCDQAAYVHGEGVEA